MSSDPSANAAADSGVDPEDLSTRTPPDEQEADDELKDLLLSSADDASFPSSSTALRRKGDDDYHETKPMSQQAKVVRLSWRMLILIVTLVGLQGRAVYFLHMDVTTIHSNEDSTSTTSKPPDKDSMAPPKNLSSLSMLDKCRVLVSDYLQTLQDLDISIGDGISWYSSWKRSICMPFEANNRTISPKPLLIGAAPGTTATRSFAKAVALLGKTVLHWKVLLKPQWVHGSWNVQSGRSYGDIFHVEDLVDPMINETIWKQQEAASILDFAQVFQSVDALFDFPFGFYVFDLLATFPNAKIIMTHRDPVNWFHKRSDWCRHDRKCLPFILRPLRLNIAHNMTEQQVVGSFYATNRLIQAMVDFDSTRYLQVDAWNRPNNGTGDWMPVIADFIGVPVPPPEANCRVPVDVEHDLKCGDTDEACKQCDQWMKNHLR